MVLVVLFAGVNEEPNSVIKLNFRFRFWSSLFVYYSLSVR